MDRRNSGQSSPPLSVASEKSLNENVTLLTWWYRLTSPPEPPSSASLSQREVARRGKLTSFIVLIAMIAVLGLLIEAVLSSRYFLVLPLAIGFAMSCAALFFNRKGNIALAGSLVLLQIVAGQSLTILASPGGLTANSLQRFDLYILTDLVAISFFPPASIFLVALANCILILLLVYLGTHDASVTHLLQTSPYSVFSYPFILQFLVASVTFLWVRSATQALARADRAEELAALERREIERQQQEIEQKHQLDTGIQQILQTHIEVANGNFRARAPLTRDNVLWQIAFSLNNLLARFQRLSQAESEFQKLRDENERLKRELYSATRGNNERQQRPGPVPPDPTPPPAFKAPTPRKIINNNDLRKI